MSDPSTGDEYAGEGLSEGSGKLAQWLAILIVVGAAVGGGWKMFSPGSASAMAAWHTDMEAGIEQARETGGPMLVLFTADWCPPCRQLKKDVLADAAVAEHLERNYVLVKIDLTNRNGTNQWIAQEAEVRGIPAMILYDRRLLEKDRIVGGMNRDTFLAWLDGRVR